MVVTPGRALRTARSLRDWVPAVVIFVIGIAVWEGAIAAFDIQKFLLPAPSDIAGTLIDQGAIVWNGGWYTFREAFFGFLIGSSAAFGFAVVVGRFARIGNALMPVAIAANAIPIIAFAPIFNAWFDPLTQTSKIAIAAVLSFFPVLVNALRGLQSVQPQQLELMRSYACGEVQTFRRLRLPTALPYIFTSLKVASVLAMIGAIIGDYFQGSFNSLGQLIRRNAQIFDFEVAWAAIFVACVFGIGFYLAVSLAERLVVRWGPSTRDA
jgi:NitT/TauT family transport system permease protein